MDESRSRVRLAVNAMATRFELVIVSGDAARARAAGEEALSEISRIERELSFYSASSLLSHLNRSAAAAPVKVPARFFDLLVEAHALWVGTGGAFDPTIGAQMGRVKVERRGRHAVGSPDTARAGRAGAGPPIPGAAPAPPGAAPAPPGAAPAPPGAAPAPPGSTPVPSPGMGAVRLDEAHRTVRYLDPGLKIDLGGIAKGYAIDEAMLLLRESGIEHALLHGGTSTARAIGRDGKAPWRIAVSHPQPERSNTLLASVDLRDASLSVSGIFGSGRLQDGVWQGHVLDPRTGASVAHTELAAVVHPSATRADALSTALLVLGGASQATTAFGTLASLTLDSHGRFAHHGPWRLEAAS